METLIAEGNLKERVRMMAQEISAHYEQRHWYQDTREPVVIIGVLTGAFVFMADLVRQLSIRTELDFIRTSTYPGAVAQAQNTNIVSWHERNLRDAHVLIVDDILDTGRTLKLIQEEIGLRHPESITTAVLLRKPDRLQENVAAQFVGFDIPDEFVVGYGMDYNGRYRSMPRVAVWSEDEFSRREKTVNSNR
jgi:hypoxanthine phosphoribosyltransferase